MLSFILCTRFSTVNADLVPPFSSDGSGQVGVWSLSGVTLVFADRIVLAPPMQHHQGSAWSTVKVPQSNWSMQVELGVSEGAGGAASGFG
jgi:hypothetical protein